MKDRDPFAVAALVFSVFAGGFWLGWVLRGASNILKDEPTASIVMGSVPVEVMPADPFKFVLPDGTEVWYERKDD